MGHALENTIESVEKAIDLKVDGIEIDVFKSKTGELIVYHDPSLKRLSKPTKERSASVGKIVIFSSL